ncbi:MAG TPA: IS630 family transposase [Pirellulales bacterium]|nr:IS630 family transposase [Pirellulales bacterium]
MSKNTAADKVVLRRFAIELLDKQMTIADVAQVVGVSDSSVKRWKKAFREGGDAALQPKPHPGSPRKLTLVQQQRLRQLLIKGPRAAGFDTELWTCRRVAAVVQRTFGVEYHPDHLGRILHDLGFSPQKPQRRAAERDEEAIARWRTHDWPRIKKRPAAPARRSSFSTKPASACSR